VLRSEAGGFMDDEAAARAVNAEPWEPPARHGQTAMPPHATTSPPHLQAARSCAVRTAWRTGRGSRWARRPVWTC